MIFSPRMVAQTPIHLHPFPLLPYLLATGFEGEAVGVGHSGTKANDVRRSERRASVVARLRVGGDRQHQAAALREGGIWRVPGCGPCGWESASNARRRRSLDAILCQRARRMEVRSLERRGLRAGAEAMAMAPLL